ncbi:MAG TPA: hypothetical protein VGN20_05010 [Mucilaginibacter sp.]
MRNLSIIELEEVGASNNIDTRVKEVINILLTAVNDWPTAILNLTDFEIEVNNFIGGEVTKDKIDLARSKIDYSKNAWQAESLSQLIEVYKFYDRTISFKGIIKDLELKLNTKNN